MTALDQHAAVLEALEQANLSDDAARARRRIFERHAPESRDDRPADWTAWCSGHSGDTKWPCPDYCDTAIGLPGVPVEVLKDWPPIWDR